MIFTPEKARLLIPCLWVYATKRRCKKMLCHNNAGRISSSLGPGFPRTLGPTDYVISLTFNRVCSCSSTEILELSENTAYHISAFCHGRLSATTPIIPLTFSATAVNGRYAPQSVRT